MNLCNLVAYTWLCEGNLGIPRIEMPQLNASVAEDFVHKMNINALCTVVNPSQLVPTQSEINYNSVMKMLVNVVYNPCDDVIIVAESFIIDGHHRWTACYLLNKNIRVMVFLHPLITILKMLQNFPGVDHYRMTI